MEHNRYKSHLDKFLEGVCPRDCLDIPGSQLASVELRRDDVRNAPETERITLAKRRDHGNRQSILLASLFVKKLVFCIKASCVKT